MANKLNDDSIGKAFKEILKNENIESFSDYSNGDLFIEICNILKNIKYLEDTSILKIVILFKYFEYILILIDIFFKIVKCCENSENEFRNKLAKYFGRESTGLEKVIDLYHLSNEV
jgi:hypothetical protein